MQKHWCSSSPGYFSALMRKLLLLYRMISWLQLLVEKEMWCELCLFSTVELIWRLRTGYVTFNHWGVPKSRTEQQPTFYHLHASFWCPTVSMFNHSKAITMASIFVSSAHHDTAVLVLISCHGLRWNGLVSMVISKWFVFLYQEELSSTTRMRWDSF